MPVVREGERKAGKAGRGWLLAPALVGLLVAGLIVLAPVLGLHWSVGGVEFRAQTLEPWVPLPFFYEHRGSAQAAMLPTTMNPPFEGEEWTVTLGVWQWKLHSHW